MSGPSTDRSATHTMAGWRIPGLLLMQLLPKTWQRSRREGMIENRPGLTVISHLVLALGIAIVALPPHLTFVASALAVDEVLQAPMPLVPGTHLVENYKKALGTGVSSNVQSAPVAPMMLNSLITEIGRASCRGRG